MDLTEGENDPGLAHLSGPAAELRQVLAAHFLRAFAHVLEIGGHLRPVTSYLTHQPKSVTVIDPKTVPYQADELHGHPCTVRHVARKFQDVAVDLPAGEYGLVLLGYSLKPFGKRAALGETLFELIDNSGLTILDYAPAVSRAREQVPLLLARPGVMIVCSVELTLTDTELANSPYARRHFIVFRSRSPGQ